MSATIPVASPRGFSRASSFAWVALAYVAGLLAALAVLATLTPGVFALEGTLEPYARLALADLAATLVVFGFSFCLGNSSVYDSYWTAVPPVACVGAWALTTAPEGPTGRQLLTFVVVATWAARLTLNWIRSWPGLDHEDFRYRDLQDKTGKLYWLVSFAGLHLFPTCVVLVTMLPLAAIYAPSARPLGALDALGAALSLGGIAMQTIADEQLRAFAKARTDRDAVCDRGLWRFSRHPNYFGEIAFWTGLAVLAEASGVGAWWSWLGVPAILGLFFFASIPMMEGRQARKAGWADYVRRTSVLVPLPPRR